MLLGVQACRAWISREDWRLLDMLLVLWCDMKLLVVLGIVLLLLLKALAGVAY